MKAIRLIAVFVLAVMLLSVPVFSATDEGMSFSADAIYRVNKKYAENPNTFEAFVNVPSSVTGRAGVILGSFGSGNPCVSFEVSDNGVPRLYVIDANGTVYDYKFSSVHINTGKWVHLAIVRDAAASKAYCYVDGVLEETKPITCKVAITSTAPLQLGGDYRDGNVQYFKGAIKSVAVWDDVRTAAEIQADMDGASGNGLIAAYDLTTLSKGKIKDIGTKGYDISLVRTWIEPEDKEPVRDYAYSFAVVGDTQRIAYNYKDQFYKIYKWILDNAEEKNTQFVFGLGDITETSSVAEWEAAMDAVEQLDGKIPYSLVRGNHDSISSFNTYVSMDKYGDVIDGCYLGDMRNSYQLLTIGEVKYLMMTLDYGASNATLAWASEVISSHPDCNVIISTHAYLFRDGTTLDVHDVCPPIGSKEGSGGYNNGDHIWDKLISKHENIVLVLSGHDPWDNIVTTQTKGDKGNTVTQMLIDPQGADNTYNGLGAVAMLYFSEDGKDVTVEYYSTFKEKYFMSESQFTMTLDVVGDGENDATIDNENNGSNDENGNNSGSNNGQEVDKPNKETKPSTETDSSGTSEVGGTDTPDTVTKEGGCGSTVAMSTLSIITLTLGACLVPKKKKR